MSGFARVGCSRSGSDDAVKYLYASYLALADQFNIPTTEPSLVRSGDQARATFISFVAGEGGCREWFVPIANQWHTALEPVVKALESYPPDRVSAIA